MSKKKIIELTEEQKQALIEAEIKENVKETFKIDGSDFEESEVTKDYTSYETQKLILLESLDEKNLMDMTNLNDDEIEDLENAIMLNMIAKNPLIHKVCIDHMRMKRSLTDDSRNLLQHLFDWSTRGFSDSSGFNPITKVLGRKGAK